MANKKVSQLVSKPSVLVTDLFPIADPTTGQLFKTTISDLGTAIGSGVSSVNTLVGAVVLDTDDIQELASPTNKWFTDTRARAALSASSPLAYNSGTGVFSIPAATSSQNGYLSSADWTTFNAKQPALSGTGFVKISGTTISYDNSTYLTTSAAASTYLALAGGTLTGALNGTSANFTGDLTISSSNPRIYLTDTDNNPDYFISNTDGTFTVYDVTNSTSRFTIGTTGNATFTNAIIGGGSITGESIYSNGIVSVGTGLTVGTTISATGSITGASIIRSGGTSSQFLKADGSVDSTAYLPLGGGTLTGALFATSASFSGFVGFGGNTSPLAAIDVTGAGIFSSSVRSSGYYLTGMTSGSGALYYNSGANRVTVANYNTSGILDFEVNGGASALTLNANLSATFKAGGSFAGALSGTSASFSSSVTASTTLIGRTSYTAGGSGGSPYYDEAIIVGQTGNQSKIQYGNSFNDNNGTYIRFVVNGIAAQNTPIYPLVLAPSGAATFSSSVTATSIGINTSTINAKLEVASGVPTSTEIQRWSYNNANANYSLRLKQDVSSGLVKHVFDLVNDGTTYANNLVLTNGNVGIGTTSPGNPLTVSSSTNNYVAEFYRNNNVDSRINITNTTTGSGTDKGLMLGQISLESYVYSYANGPLIFGTNGSPAMRITSDGDVLIGKTAKDFTVQGTQSEAVGRIFGVTTNISAENIFINRINSQTGNFINFLYNSGSVGTISTNGTTTSYNITSDYRLKQDLKPIKGLEIVNKINVYDYEWKSDKSRMDGVLAHELAEILPYAVSGVKDGEQMQSVDYSKIVPVMVQAIKELKAKIETLENK
jgi:hypothetical protein